MFPYNSTKEVAALAVRDINNSGILKGYNLSLTNERTNRDSATATGAFLERMNVENPPIGVVGERASRVCLSLSYIASWYRIPQLTYACTSPTLSNRRSFFFLRATPSDRYQTQALAEMIASFNLSPNLEVATISVTDDYGTRYQTVRRSAVLSLSIGIDKREPKGLCCRSGKAQHCCSSPRADYFRFLGCLFQYQAFEGKWSPRVCLSRIRPRPLSLDERGQDSGTLWTRLRLVLRRWSGNATHFVGFFWCVRP
jgi:hypothetical protein